MDEEHAASLPGRTSAGPESASAEPTANPVLRWLQSSGSKHREMLPFVEAFAAELLQSGINLSRLTTGIHILHPQIDASSCLWEPGKPVTERRFRLAEGGQQQLENSPLPIVYGGTAFRARLDGPSPPGEFPILAELRAEGTTDYLALPLPFSDGSSKAVTYATKRPGGFLPGQVRFLQELVPTLAMIFEIQTLHRTTLTLLDTYVGPTAGRRVLDGAIKRGMCERIDAVIWLCDLRGFTALSETLPGEDLVGFLNDYFGAMTSAVGSHGGEVLKFIGDALLAIFPLAGADRSAVAALALGAVGQAEAAIGLLDAERERLGLPTIRFGLALHVGEVLYGNIGGADRLDFTVIGQAVNVAARIEALTKELGRKVLLSSEFASLVEVGLEPVGRFPLKGVGAEQIVYGRNQDRLAGERLRHKH